MSLAVAQVEARPGSLADSVAAHVRMAGAAAEGTEAGSGASGADGAEREGATERAPATASVSAGRTAVASNAAPTAAFA